MKKNITKEEEKALLGDRQAPDGSGRQPGDLEVRDNDSEDFIEVQSGASESNGGSLPAGTDEQINQQPRHSPHRGLCHGWQNNPDEPVTPQTGADVATWMRRGGKKHMEERMMDTIVEIYNHMDDSDKDAFTLEDAEDMVEDQIRMDKEAGREPLAYDPQFFYDTIVELMEQDAE